jgi:hypothetical protein
MDLMGKIVDWADFAMTGEVGEVTEADRCPKSDDLLAERLP